MTPQPLLPTTGEQPPIVLILGARGRLGMAATRAFAQAGWQVLAQVRPGAQRATLPAIAGVWWMPVAVDDTAALAAQAQGAQVVVHALNPAYTHKAWREEAPALMEAAIAVTRQLRATLMLPGNVYNFGEAMPPVLREDTPQAATGFKGRMRVQLEQRLQAATQGGEMRAVVLRAGDFFGSGTGSLDRPGHRQGPAPGPHHLARPAGRGHALGVPARPGSHAGARGAGAAPAGRFRGVCRLRRPPRHRAAVAAQLHGGHCGGAGLAAYNGSAAGGEVALALAALGSLVAPTFAAVANMRYLWSTPHRLDNTRLRPDRRRSTPRLTRPCARRAGGPMAGGHSHAHAALAEPHPL